MAMYQKPVYGIDFDPTKQKVVFDPNSMEHVVRDDVRDDTAKEYIEYIEKTFDGVNLGIGGIDYKEYMDTLVKRNRGELNSKKIVLDDDKENNKNIDDGFDEELFYRVFDLVQQNRPNGESNWVIYVPYEKKVIRNDVYRPVYKISHYPISKKFDIEIYYMYGYVEGDSLQGIHPKRYYVNYNTRPDEYNLLLGCLDFWKNQQIIENKKQELSLQYNVSFWQKLKLSMLRIVRDLLLRLKRV